MWNQLAIVSFATALVLFELLHCLLKISELIFCEIILIITNKTFRVLFLGMTTFLAAWCFLHQLFLIQATMLQKVFSIVMVLMDGKAVMCFYVLKSFSLKIINIRNSSKLFIAEDKEWPILIWSTIIFIVNFEQLLCQLEIFRVDF